MRDDWWLVIVLLVFLWFLIEVLNCCICCYVSSCAFDYLTFLMVWILIFMVSLFWLALPVAFVFADCVWRNLGVLDCVVRLNLWLFCCLLATVYCLDGFGSCLLLLWLVWIRCFSLFVKMFCLLAFAFSVWTCLALRWGYVGFEFGFAFVMLVLCLSCDDRLGWVRYLFDGWLVVRLIAIALVEIWLVRY